MCKAATIGMLLLLGACLDAHYRIVVELPGEPSQAERIEVSLVSSCADASPVEDPPARTVLQIEIDAGAGEAPSLGSVSSGRWALHVRAWRSGCVLYAAGCVPVHLEPDGDGALVLPLEPVAERGCAAHEECRDGRCAPTDGGGAGDADAGGDADADGGASCRPEGGFCSGNEDCCLDRCLVGFCVGCNETGRPCEADYECCNGSCGGDGLCVECHAPGTYCGGQPAGFCCGQCKGSVCT